MVGLEVVEGVVDSATVVDEDERAIMRDMTDVMKVIRHWPCEEVVHS